MRITGILILIILVCAAVVFSVYTKNNKIDKDIIYKLNDEDVKDVVFSHDIHNKTKNIRCNECHSSLFKMNDQNFKVYKKEGKEIMPLFEENMFCGKCHNKSRAFGTDEACDLCHSYKEKGM